MRSYYIADGIIQGILTVICAIDITHLVIFSESWTVYLLYMLLIWQLSAGVINFILRKKALRDKVLRVLQYIQLCVAGIIFLMVQADKWLDPISTVWSSIFTGFVYASFFLLLPALILSIMALTIRRSIVTLRHSATPPRI
ncbi:hypothetical protein MRBLMN1_000383 [Chitinophaga ginsengisegetis]|uniref:hypothetical protein n=1 Tax=Chitinophaga ginsengisegetis TaxID=393003 RepID=UPI0034375416